jgi:hypothetical protein
MSNSLAETPTTQPTPPRPRFSWPMRIFLGIILFDMIFHSFAALIPYKKWCEEYGMDTMPRGLPDPEEKEELRRATENANHDLLTERIMSSFDSLWEFWRPWPGAETRKKMVHLGDVGKVSIAWTATRLDFLEHLVRIRQTWSMFAPNVADDHDIVRARLVYADGSTTTIRSVGDPLNLLHYESFRFLGEKPLQATLRLNKDPEARLGFCNLLSHRHARNEAGSPLKTIYLMFVNYKYPEPGKDVRAALAVQQVPLGQEKIPPFFEYDVSTRKGRKIQESDRK